MAVERGIWKRRISAKRRVRDEEGEWGGCIQCVYQETLRRQRPLQKSAWKAKNCWWWPIHLKLIHWQYKTPDLRLGDHHWQGGRKSQRTRTFAAIVFSNMWHGASPITLQLNMKPVQWQPHLTSLRGYGISNEGLPLREQPQASNCCQKREHWSFPGMSPLIGYLILRDQP